MATKAKTPEKKAAPKKKAQSYADKDRHLVKALEKATHDLIEHRWHWTHDLDNQKAVNIDEYSLVAGIDRQDVLRYAEARELYEREHAEDENYTAVQALDNTNADAATMR